MGRKTIGFTFDRLKKVELIDKGLYIEVDDEDIITLSRKRFNEESLTQLYEILYLKKQFYE